VPPPALKPYAIIRSTDSSSATAMDARLLVGFLLGAL